MPQTEADSNLHVLKVYLRDYFSIYCSQGKSYRRRCQGNPVYLTPLVRYWTQVETGTSESSPRRKEKGGEKTSIASKLHWPRTTLVIQPSDISPNGRLATALLPCSLFYFHGEVRFSPMAKQKLKEDAFRCLTNLHSLDMTDCNEEAVTDATFRHLTNLRSLKMRRCYQETITNDAFRHLTNLQSLDLSSCLQEAITDDAFRHLTNLQSLVMSYCDQQTITDNAFRHLGKLQYLEMSYCKQETITDDAFRHLTNLQSLIMEACD